MRIRHLLVVLTVLAASVVAEADPPKTVPPEIPQNQVDGAKIILADVPVERQFVFNALRFLLRPDYEKELLTGRSVRVAALEPFETYGTAQFVGRPLDRGEMLRLLALLSAGFPATEPLKYTTERLLATPIPASENLSPYGVMALTLLHALQHTGLAAAERDTERLKARMQEVYTLSQAKRNATSGRSEMISESMIVSTWFANQFWRAVITRSAHAAGCEVQWKAWGEDLKTLSATWRKDFGYTQWIKGNPTPDQCWHTNLIAHATVGLALSTPEGLLPKGALTAVRSNLKHSGKLLQAQSGEYTFKTVSGARLLLLSLLPDECAPETQTPAEWRKRVFEVSTSLRDNSGCVLQRSGLPGDLDLLDPQSSQSYAATVETCLACIAASGPLLGGQPLRMLADYGAAGIGRVMYAFTLLHAAGARIGSNDFKGRVNLAIEEGCAYLAAVQNQDGSFPGMYASYTGNTAIALLAMLHGGASRDDVAVKRGVEYLRKSNSPEDARMATRGGTYSDAIVLMMLQKYYEPEQRAAGMLYADNPKDFEAARAQLNKDLPEKDREWISQLARNLRNAQVGGNEGGYTYYPQEKTSSTAIRRAGGDNSNSQYAMLGIKAACLLGVEIAAVEFEREAKRLIAQYEADERMTGKVKYEHPGDERESERKTSSENSPLEIQPGGWGYGIGYKGGRSMQMTAAGIGTLTICMDELKARGKLTQQFAQQIGLHIRGAEAWLEKNYYTADTLQDRNGYSYFSAGSDGHGVFYNLYSVERGCELAGIRSLMGNVDWYRIGAEALLDNQNLDGSWGREREYPGNLRANQPMMVSTCMAILFLKRASLPVITEHRKREREAEKEAEKEAGKDGEKPKGPITPGPEEKKK